MLIQSCGLNVHDSDIPIQGSLLIPVTDNTRGHFNRFCQLSTKILCFYHSFFPAAIKIWNSLPSLVINCNNVEHYNLCCILLIANYRCVIP